MTFGRLSAGLVVAGCLVAGALGAGCSEGGGADETSPQVGENSSDYSGTIDPSPSPTPTATSMPWYPIYRPRIDDPQAACAFVFPDSNFAGYLIEMAAGDTCPDISTSLGTWAEDPGDCLNTSCSTLTPIGKAYYVGATPAATCRYTKKPSIYITWPPPTPEQRYNALATSLGYPDQISRDIQGILCVKPAALPVAPESTEESSVRAPDALAAVASIPVCRKCATAYSSKVSLPQ